ncbi:MAG: OmpA family protein [Endomicrobium sp.]|jgi:outer membrane protein OmpA-like peptidoglycan-associated protein|nr:OmpA family protein [Endomicrobium sp.]
MKTNYFLIIAISVFISAPQAVFAAANRSAFETDSAGKQKADDKVQSQNVFEEQRDLSRANSERAMSEYEAQQARLDAELEKRRFREIQNELSLQNGNSEIFKLEEDKENEPNSRAEITKNEQTAGKRKAEIAKKTKELAEKKAQLEKQIKKSKFKPSPLDGEEITQNAAKPDNEISDAELEKNVTQSEERRMNPALFRAVIPADFFVKNGYELTKKAKDEIAKYAAQIKKLQYRKITVEGHSDSLETPLEAKRTSRLRAKAVYDELIENEIDASQTQYVGLADRIREETNKTKKGRFANRRTEIFVE